MTHPSKSKGNRFERELVNSAKQSGLEAERAYASNGKALGECDEVDLKVGGYRIQAKRRKKLPAYLQIPEGCDAVAFRQDNADPLVLVSWWQYLDLVAGCVGTRNFPVVNRTDSPSRLEPTGSDCLAHPA